jgi:heterodisulfide reductase subunit A
VDLSKVTLNKPRPIMADYDMGLVQRSSIYIPFAQAIPKVALIDRKTCMHYLKDTCKSCENFCEAGAIDYEQQDEIEELDVGAVVLSPGFEQFDPDLKKELGYSRYPNVLSSLQFERLLSASGPYLGKVLRISDEKSPGKIAWIQCVGSREVECMRPRRLLLPRSTPPTSIAQSFSLICAPMAKDLMPITSGRRSLALNIFAVVPLQ